MGLEFNFAEIVVLKPGGMPPSWTRIIGMSNNQKEKDEPPHGTIARKFNRQKKKKKKSNYLFLVHFILGWRRPDERCIGLT
jgi:hypothetical protein